MPPPRAWVTPTGWRGSMRPRPNWRRRRPTPTRAVRRPSSAAATGGAAVRRRSCIGAGEVCARVARRSIAGQPGQRRGNRHVGMNGHVRRHRADDRCAALPRRTRRGADARHDAAGRPCRAGAATASPCAFGAMVTTPAGVSCRKDTRAFIVAARRVIPLPHRALTCCRPTPRCSTAASPIEQVALCYGPTCPACRYRRVPCRMRSRGRRGLPAASSSRARPRLESRWERPQTRRVRRDG